MIVQMTRTIEKGTGKENLESKKSLQILVIVNFQYNWRLCWNLCIVAFIMVIVKLSKMIIATTLYMINKAVANF